MEQMTVAQALREVAQIKGKIDEWSKRLEPAIFWFESDPPAFAFEAAREAMNNAVKRMVELQTAIAVANAGTSLDWSGRKIPLALAVRTLTELKGAIKRIDDLTVRNTDSGVETQQEVDYDDEGKRFVKKNLRSWKCALTATQKAALLEALREKFFKLNDAVETLNHKTLIVEVAGLSDASM